MRFASHGSFVVAALLVAISLSGILIPETYARETANWATQAIAQDWFDLLVVAPALFVAASWAARGSQRGQVVLAGVLLNTIYTLVIYAFAVHLNSLFLLYCSALGVALYALIALGGAIMREPPRFASQTPRRAAGGFLILLGAAFGALWLVQLIPAAVTGREPNELVETGLVTNPVHVIDLSFILPLHVIAGVMLWRRRLLGLVLAPALFAFGALMSASIAVMAVMAEIRGISSGGYPVAIAMGLIATVSAGLLGRCLRAIRVNFSQDRT